MQCGNVASFGQSYSDEPASESGSSILYDRKGSNLHGDLGTCRYYRAAVDKPNALGEFPETTRSYDRGAPHRPSAGYHATVSKRL